MTSQIISLAAQFADRTGAAGLAERLAEPSVLTVVVVGMAGVVIGRFLLGRGED